MRFGYISLVCLLATGCALSLPGKTATGLAGKRAATQSSVSQQAQLIKALHNMVAANRASTVSTAACQASSVISNNSGSVLSDNGLGLIANNGGSLISDKGAGYRLLVPAPLVAESEDLVTETTLLNAKSGIYKTFDKATYKADREKALLDHFKWDDMAIKLNGLPPSMTADVTYTLMKVSAKRLSFLDALRSHETHQVTFPQGLTGTPAGMLIGWAFEFDMTTSLLGAESDTASFKGSAGPDDFARLSNGQSLPKRLTVTGSHANGTYAGEMVGTDYPVVTLEHVEKGTGKKSQLTVTLKKGGMLGRTIALPDQQLRVELDTELSGKGVGKLFDTSGPEPAEVAAIACDTDGVGTFTMLRPTGEPSTFKAQLY